MAVLMRWPRFVGGEADGEDVAAEQWGIGGAVHYATPVVPLHEQPVGMKPAPRLTRYVLRKYAGGAVAIEALVEERIGHAEALELILRRALEDAGATIVHERPCEGARG
jgi:hypothetical protein